MEHLPVNDELLAADLAIAGVVGEGVEEALGAGQLRVTQFGWKFGGNAVPSVLFEECGEGET